MMEFSEFLLKAFSQTESARVFDHDRRQPVGEILSHAEWLEAYLRPFAENGQCRIGILLDNSPLFVAALTAIIKMETRTVLLSTRSKAYELDDAMWQASVGILVTDPQRKPVVEQLQANPRSVAQIDWPSVGTLELWELEPVPSVALSDETHEAGYNEFICQLTSGVSGQSRIVSRTYENIIDEIVNYTNALGLDESDKVLCLVPFFHAYGLINGLLPCLHTGATLIVPRRFLPAEIISLSNRLKPTILVGVPFMYDMLCKTHVPEETDLSSYRLCLSAGAKISRKIAEDFMRRFNAPVNQLYGSTETGIVSVNLPWSKGSEIDSVGFPIGGREVRVVDEDKRSLKPGCEGEIIVRSPGTTRGYLNRPSLNKTTFVDGWFHTGDIGSFDAQGRLYITGRRSSFINVAGLKLDPFEVERAILGHKDVKECAVVGIPRDDLGEDVKAFVVLKNDTSRKELAQFCASKLAGYKVPRTFAFVKELPRSPTGKVLKKYLLGGSSQEE